MKTAMTLALLALTGLAAGPSWSHHHDRDFPISIADAEARAAEAFGEIDANGDLLTPGFVDIHTHYDGQVCWDKQVTPSSWHGVTGCGWWPGSTMNP